MNRPWVPALWRAVFAGIVLVLVGPAWAQATPRVTEVRAQLAGLRVPFIANQGQVDATVAYYAPTFAGTVFVTRQGELVYSLPGRATGTPRSRPRPSSNAGWSLTETLVEGRARPAAWERGETNVSDFRGNDPARWRARIPTYDQVSLGEVWPGVTMSLRAHGHSIEKIFTLEPGASVNRIRVRMHGARSLAVNPEGALVARTGLGDVTFTAPAAYQERDGVRHPVAVAYRRQGAEYGFSVGAYDRSLPLVIDPLLQSTYLGAGGIDDAYALVVSADTGDVYVAGGTSSDTFPGTAGGAQELLAGVFDAFVARLNASLTGLTQATYLGGSDFDTAYAIAIAPGTGDVYVAGDTSSVDFPGTSGGPQPTYGGGSSDTFIARLPSSLTALTQATYLGGGNRDEAYGLAIAATTGHVYMVGYTRSTNFPGTGGGAQPTYSGGLSDGFAARLNGGLTALIQATYLGGSATDHANALAIAPSTGDVYVAGDTTSTDFPGTSGGAQPINGGNQDAFVVQLPGTLTTFTRATYLGGSADDVVNAIAIAQASGDVYVAGYTNSTDFPHSAEGAQPANGGGYDAVVARLSSNLTSLTQATYLGGSDDEIALAIAIATTGAVYVAGATRSSPFPGTSGGIQPAIGGLIDAYIARLNTALTSLSQATYLGGGEDDAAFALAISPTNGDVYVAGGTRSTNFPGTTGGAQPAYGGVEDAFISRLSPSLASGSGPDLTLTKAHTGNFTRGQTGALYAITVTNVGGAATAGGVTVTDTLPTGLSATALSGSGWSCTLGTLTCTRGDALANGSSYPVITLTVNVATDAPSSVTNTVVVSGGSDVNPANNTANDVTTVTTATFADVPTTHPFYTWIEALVHAGITGGCAANPPMYCPDNQVTRDQMAVFLLRGIHGGGYQPPAATGTMFADVPASLALASWIEQLAREAITAGCAASPPQYCPAATATRGQMAVFLLRAKYGAGYQPPAATGMFVDVPVTYIFAPWIEQLAREGITGGCGTSPARYCPDDPVTRGQMAVFLVRTFQLPL